MTKKKTKMIKCPRGCGQDIPLVVEGDRERAYHDCLHGRMLPVHDAPRAIDEPYKSFEDEELGIEEQES